MVNAKFLSQLYGRPEVVFKPWVPYLNESLVLAKVNSDKGLAHFLSQIGHESGGLLYTTELWGPTKQQLRYERTPVAYWGKYNQRFHTRTWTNKLAFDLGNFAKGDGYLYRGRGLIQVTGRANYVMANQRLNTLLGSSVGNLVTNPSLLSSFQLATYSAADYWVRRNLDTIVDTATVSQITRVVNGGYNGLSHRQLLYNRFFLLNRN